MRTAAAPPRPAARPQGQGAARPGALGARPFGGATAAGAVVDVPDEFAAQDGGEQDPVVAGEVGDGGTVAGLDDGEGGAGAFHLAGRGGEDLAGGRGFEAEDGGHGARGEAVAYGQFERFALFGVVPAASGQASCASSRRCASAAGAESGVGAGAFVRPASLVAGGGVTAGNVRFSGRAPLGDFRPDCFPGCWRCA